MGHAAILSASPPTDPRPRWRAVLLGLGLALLIAAKASAEPPQPPEPLRIAVFNAGLSRDGPGLLLRDILGGRDARIAAAATVISEARADVLLLPGTDFDHGLAALGALADLLEAEHDLPYPHRFALRPNTGMQTGLDMDGDGRLGTPDDAQGWGGFAGARGLALLSKLPLDEGAVRDFSAFLWRDLPGALLPEDPAQPGIPFPNPEVFAIQRLSTTAHWDVPVILPDGTRLHLLVFYAGPPVFGGPHDRNLRRNHDEVRFWTLLLDGALPMPPPPGRVVVIGGANLDPEDGDGLHQAIRDLLAHPALQDPAPRSPGAVAAQGPNDAGHRGDPALDTVLWDAPRQPGNLRVDYVLPDAGLRVLDAGVIWPLPDHPLAGAVATASRHRLVWVDIDLPRPGLPLDPAGTSR